MYINWLEMISLDHGFDILFGRFMFKKKMYIQVRKSVKSSVFFFVFFLSLYHYICVCTGIYAYMYV